MNIRRFFCALSVLFIFMRLFPVMAQSTFTPVYTPQGGMQQSSFRQNPPIGPPANILQHMREQQAQRTRQQNEELRQRFGHTPSPKDKKELYRELVIPPQLRLQNEMKELLQESERNDFIASEKAHYQSKTYLDDLPRYIKARDLIADMLQGRRDLSVKDAFYLAVAP